MSQDWHKKWADGQTNFHQNTPHKELLRFQNEFLNEEPQRVLVPLCGKSVDMLWLADQGHEVIGVEFVPKAVEEFFAENQRKFQEEDVGGYKRFRSGRITIYCADIFVLDRSVLKGITRIWDRAAHVALPKEIRAKYTQHLQTLASQGTKIMLNVFEYDQKTMSGPPHSVSPEEVNRLYASQNIRTLYRSETPTPFPDKGHTYWRSTGYLIDFVD